MMDLRVFVAIFVLHIVAVCSGLKILLSSSISFEINVFILSKGQ